MHDASVTKLGSHAGEYIAGKLSLRVKQLDVRWVPGILHMLIFI
jgi:hypothetical protein